MKKISLTLTGFLTLGFALATHAQNIAGYSFQAGLTTLTDTSAAPGAGPLALSYTTDNSLDTVLANIGAFGGTGFGGTFGGGGYAHGSGADIILTTLAYNGTPVSGSFSVSLLLANGGSTPGITYSDANFVNAGYSDNFSYIQANDGAGATSSFTASYLPLNIANFATGGEAVVGIEFNNFTSSYLDLGYVGVTTLANTAPVPEPTALALAGLGGLTLLARRRRQA